eukprot:4425596-Prymnesium_polylepis.1
MYSRMVSTTARALSGSDPSIPSHVRSAVLSRSQSSVADWMITPVSQSSRKSYSDEYMAHRPPWRQGAASPT